MKKFIRSGIAALLALITAVSLCGCTSLTDLLLRAEDYKAANSPSAGFVLTVPAPWVCGESVIYDGEGFTRQVTATFSNSATDNSTVSVVTHETDLSPKDFLLAEYEAQKGLFAEISEAVCISDQYVLGSEKDVKGVQYEYTVKRTEGSTAAYVMQVAAAKNGRMLLFTFYAPDKATYEKHTNAVHTVLGKLTFSEFQAPTPLGKEGMVKITDDIALFSLSVPGTWYDAVEARTDYCKAISPDGKTAVIGMTFLPVIPDNQPLTVANYWSLVLRKELENRFGDTLTVTEEAAEASLPFGKVARYSYHGTEGGQDYYFSQILFVQGYSIFTVSVSSTEPINPDAGEVASIFKSFGF